MNLSVKINKDILLFGKYNIKLLEISHYQGDLRRNYTYHYHNFCELSMVIRGKTHFMVNSKCFTCHPGELVLVSPNCLHAVSVSELSPDDSIWTFRLEIDPESELARRLTRRAVLVPLGQKGKFLQELLAQWLLLETTSRYSREYVAPITSLLLHLIFEELENSGQEFTDDTDDYYRQILYYIMRHYQEEFSLDDLAARFAVSKSHLMRCFKQNFGITPIHYRNELLIDASCYYLTNSEMSTREISDLLTFDTHSYYLRTFNKFMGITPTQFREKFRQERSYSIADPTAVTPIAEHLNFLYPLNLKEEENSET